VQRTPSANRDDVYANKTTTETDMSNVNVSLNTIVHIFNLIPYFVGIVSDVLGRPRA